jgi:hypothetical protein
MTDIVERLRLLKSGAAWYCDETEATLEDAADEIERLQKALRQILQQCADYEWRVNIAATALAALKETGHD